MLFGSDDQEIFEQMNFMIKKAPEMILNPLDIVSFMMLTKFKLNPYTNGFRDKMSKLSASIIKEFERTQAQDGVQKNTFLGGMANHNRNNSLQ